MEGEQLQEIYIVKYKPMFRKSLLIKTFVRVRGMDPALVERGLKKKINIDFDEEYDFRISPACVLSDREDLDFVQFDYNS